MPSHAFCRGREHKATTFLFFSWTLIQFFKIQIQKNICQHLTNWTRWNKRDKFWGSANSRRKWPFRSRRRRCCLRWCYTRRFETTIFSATQRCNIAVSLFRMVKHCSSIATLCCAKNSRCESSRVISPLSSLLTRTRRPRFPKFLFLHLFRVHTRRPTIDLIFLTDIRVGEIRVCAWK